MRIVIAHSQLNDFGGGERCVLELLRYLSRSHEVALWAGGYDPARTYDDLRHFARHDVPSAGWLWQIPRADAVVSHSFGAHLLALRYPHTVCYLHTLRSIYFGNELRPSLIARRRLDMAAIRRAAVVLANSQFTANRAQERYQRTVEVVSPGADDALFQLPEQTGDYALYVGRLAPEKGVERLIRWSATLPLDLVLVGAGTPDYLAYLRSIAGPRTRFHGTVTGDALLALYARCRCLAFLPYAEEFGLAALEAMAAAKPIITVPEGGLLELVEHERTGLLIHTAEEFQSAVLRLTASETLCLQMGRAARERARAYTWGRYAQRIEEICQTLPRSR